MLTSLFKSRPKDADAPLEWSALGYSLTALAVAGALVFGGGYWAATADLAGAVIAQGELQIAGQRKTVQHPDGGVVQELLVEEGDQVERGQVLVRLDPTIIAAELEIVETRLDEAIAQTARLEAERIGATEIMLPEADQERFEKRPSAERTLSGQIALFRARLDTQTQKRARLVQRVEQAKAEVDGKKGQIGALERQFDIARSELIDRRSLFERRLVPRNTVTSLEREVARTEGDLNRLKAEAAQAEGQVSEFEIQVLELDSDYRERATQELRAAATQVAELRQQRTKLLNSIDNIEIRAPISGTVLDLQVHTVGGVVSAAEPLMDVVPDSAELVATARIDRAQRDQVRTNQSARVMFPGFNQRTTPELSGKIKSIAKDTLIDERLNIAYYPVVVEIPKEEIDRLRSSISVDLAAGMPIQVNVETQSRTALNYLLKPFFDSLENAVANDN